MKNILWLYLREYARDTRNLISTRNRASSFVFSLFLKMPSFYRDDCDSTLRKKDSNDQNQVSHDRLALCARLKLYGIAIASNATFIPTRSFRKCRRDIASSSSNTRRFSRVRLIPRTWEPEVFAVFLLRSWYQLRVSLRGFTWIIKRAFAEVFVKLTAIL